MFFRPIRLQQIRFTLFININVIDFLHRDNNQGKIAFNTFTAGWIRPGLLSHTQAFLDLPGVDLGLFEMLWSH